MSVRLIFRCQFCDAQPDPLMPCASVVVHMPRPQELRMSRLGGDDLLHTHDRPHRFPGPAPRRPDRGAPMTSADAADGLTVADVMHAEFEALPPNATVGDVRDWLGTRERRRLALIADGTRFLCALTAADVAHEERGSRPAVDVARRQPTLSPDSPAARGRDLVRESPDRRVAVVDGDGRLVGVLALTADGRRFSCR